MLVALGGIGGILLVLTTIVVIGRAIFRQVNATEENTAALGKLTTRVDAAFQVQSDHETRITVLEDRIKR